ncbi:MAG: hypothetical protein CVV29_07770 [Methanobacteriales archaeon HGW-Methanobacteriales-2]|nr:MAG: hypothetical protein CVV29_07770 [Methanobacteriales archaeon HGW-Methanobacteriales-2]
MKKLLTILGEQSPSKVDKFNLLKGQVKDILPKIRIIFSRYNNHDIKHAETVVDILDDILPANIKQKLNCEEIFCLLSAVWLHDIGMVPDKSEIDEFENSDKERREEIRKKHHIRSYNFVLSEDSFNLDTDEKKIIANICRAHRQINIKDSLDEIHRISSSRANIRLQFLGAILRIADECDITSKRVSKHYIEEARTNIGFSLHDKKHELIEDVYLESDELIIKASVTSQDDLEIVNESKKNIEDEIQEVQDILIKNEFNLHSVDVKFDNDKWIERKITLILADCKERTIDQIKEETDNDGNVIKKSIENLEARKIIRGSNQEGNSVYLLSEDFFTFTRVLEMNYGFDSLKDYIYSDFSLKIVEKDLMPYLMDLYNFVLTDNSEIKRRTEILRKSPTAVYLGLNGKEIFGPNLNISLMQGKYLLDLLLLLGFYYDTYRYEMIIENIDFFLDEYIKPLCAEICTNLPDYIDFFNKAQESARKNLSEKISETVTEGKTGKNKFTIRVNSNKGEPDFLDMVNASRKTGKPFEITGDRLSGFESNFDIPGKVTALKIKPELQPEDSIFIFDLGISGSDIIFKGLQFARKVKNKEIILSTERRNLPYKFEIITDESKVLKGGNFNFSLSPEKADVSHVLKWEKFLRGVYLNKNVFLKEPLTGKLLMKTSLEIDKESMGSEKYLDLLEKLLFIQREIGKKIIIPENYNISDNDIQEINRTHNLLLSKEITVPIISMNVSLGITTIKEILSSKDKQGLFNSLSITYPDFVMDALNSKFNLGRSVIIGFNKFKIGNIDELSDIHQKNENESLILTIQPEDELVTIKVK